jgi:hypothetical protein
MATEIVEGAASSPDAISSYPNNTEGDNGHEWILDAYRSLEPGVSEEEKARRGEGGKGEGGGRARNYRNGFFLLDSSLSSTLPYSFSLFNLLRQSCVGVMPRTPLEKMNEIHN